MKAENAEQLVDEVIRAMDELLLKMKPDLDKVEADLLTGMKDFGASDHDVAKVREWLRPMIDAEIRKGIFLQVTKGL